MIIMVFTIQRYIFRDLLKTFILATVILSTVLGLGVMLRPLREFNVNPANVPTLILCTLPITLTMVMPIAALLSATVNYGRLSVDNEINACKSSGINLLTLIYPALALALLVGMATLLMAFHVIPSFTNKFESIIKTDAEAIIFRNIQKKGNLGDLFPDIHIHADYAIPEEHRLTGVVVQRRSQREIDWNITAEQVVIDFESLKDENQIKLYLHHALMMDDQGAADLGELTTMSINLPRLLQDNIKFKKLADLQAIQQDMTLFEPIADMLTEIHRQLMVESFFTWCAEQLIRPQRCLELRREPDLIRVYAENCKMKHPSRRSDQKKPEKNRTANLSAPKNGFVKATYYYSTYQGTVIKHYQARRAQLTVIPVGQRPSAILKLQEVQWNYPNTTTQYHLERYDIANINLPDDIVIAARLVTLDDLLSAPAGPDQADGSPYLQNLKKRIRRETDRLGVEIKVELHSRLAFGVSCVVLVLLGAALGIIFRSGHLLTAFGVSFIPTALCLITIFTGKHIAEQEGVSTAAGICFLWSGIFAAAVANAVIYRRLLKR